MGARGGHGWCGKPRAAIKGPVFVAELADRLGYTPDYFRRHIDRLIIEQRMPSPLPALGWKRWDRQAIETWLQRPAFRLQAANDAAAIAPDDIDAQRARLAQVYGHGAR